MLYQMRLQNIEIFYAKNAEPTNGWSVILSVAIANSDFIGQTDNKTTKLLIELLLRNKRNDFVSGMH